MEFSIENLVVGPLIGLGLQILWAEISKKITKRKYSKSGTPDVPVKTENLAANE